MHKLSVPSSMRQGPSVHTGVLWTLWLPRGVELSEEVESWRVRELWRDECMLASTEQGLPESRYNLGDAGDKKHKRHISNAKKNQQRATMIEGKGSPSCPTNGYK